MFLQYKYLSIYNLCLLHLFGNIVRSRCCFPGVCSCVVLFTYQNMFQPIGTGWGCADQRLWKPGRFAALIVTLHTSPYLNQPHLAPNWLIQPHLETFLPFPLSELHNILLIGKQTPRVQNFDVRREVIERRAEVIGAGTGPLRWCLSAPPALRVRCSQSWSSASFSARSCNSRDVLVKQQPQWGKNGLVHHEWGLWTGLGGNSTPWCVPSDSRSPRSYGLSRQSWRSIWKNVPSGNWPHLDAHVDKHDPSLKDFELMKNTWKMKEFVEIKSKKESKLFKLLIRETKNCKRYIFCTYLLIWIKYKNIFKLLKNISHEKIFATATKHAQNWTIDNWCYVI